MVIPGNTGLGQASSSAVQGQFLTLANCDLLLGNLYTGRFGYTYAQYNHYTVEHLMFIGIQFGS